MEGFVGNGERQRMLYNYWRRERGRYEQGKREDLFDVLFASWQSPWCKRRQRVGEGGGCENEERAGGVI